MQIRCEEQEDEDRNNIALMGAKDSVPSSLPDKKFADKNTVATAGTGLSIDQSLGGAVEMIRLQQDSLM